MCLQDDSLFEKEPLHFSPTEPTTPKFSPISGDATYDAWLSSRYSRGCQEAPLAAGGHRPLNRANIGLAYVICKECAWDLFQLLWSLHPVRAAVMVALNLARGLFPAFKGYSQALIINEVCIILSDPFQLRLNYASLYSSNPCSRLTIGHGQDWHVCSSANSHEWHWKACSTLLRKGYLYSHGHLS